MERSGKLQWPCFQETFENAVKDYQTICMPKHYIDEKIKGAKRGFQTNSTRNVFLKNLWVSYFLVTYLVWKLGRFQRCVQSLWNHTQHTLNRIIIVILILHTVYNHIVSKYSLFLFSSQTLSVSLGGQSRPLLLDLDPLTDAFVATSRSLFASQAINTSLTLLLKHTHCPPLRVSSDSKQNP